MFSIQRFILLGTLVQVVLGLAPLHKAKNKKDAIPNKYIVVLNNNVPDVDALINTLTGSVSRHVDFVYKHGLKGFAGRFNAAALQLIRLNPAVAYVEQDMVYTINAAQSPAPYNLAITSDTGAPLAPQDQNTYYYKDCSNAPVVTVYVIDTGIDSTHPSFGNRAYQPFNSVSYEPNQDLNGHGTHVAGIVGSVDYGVFKCAFMAGVKVLDSTGVGSTSTVVDGINSAVGNGVGNPSVINLSLGAQGPCGDCQAMNDAVEAAVGNGITTVVAAGNSGGDACSSYPASAPNAITVGAIDTNYETAFSTNYGNCVDIFAPGVEVISTYLNNGTAVFNGTSQATPHISGLAAYFIYHWGNTYPGHVYNRLMLYASHNVVFTGGKYGPNNVGNNGERK